MVTRRKATKRTGRYDKTAKPSNNKAYWVGLILLILAVIGGEALWINRADWGLDNPKPVLRPLPVINPLEPGDLDNNALIIEPPVVSEPVVEVKAGKESGGGVEDAQSLPEKPEDLNALFRDDVVKLSPKLSDWLEGAELIRKFLLLINDMAQETLLLKHTEFLKPKTPFVVEERNGKFYMGPENYRRYDAFSTAVDKIDVAGAIEMYKKFRPALVKIFAEFAALEVNSMEDSLTKAAAELLSVPIMEAPIELVRPSVYYKYADQKLEAFNPVYKQMLRMGPTNTRIIQNKVRQLIEALVNIKE